MPPHPNPLPEGEGFARARLTLDDVELPIVLLRFRAPHSYTGEHSAELQLPGNPVLLERVIDGLIDSASARGIEARRAEAGEFTARGFFLGKMSLTEAEGVAATIAARSDAQLRAARLLSNGALGVLARGLGDELASALALVEAGIDFTDQEDVIAIGPADLHRRLRALEQRIGGHLNSAVGAEQLESLPWVVITGEPNAGKSTLFNALLGRERAVVSGVPGTTRDVLAEALTVETTHGPAQLMLVDLAGAGTVETLLDEKMQSAARAATDRSELILRCVPLDEDAGPVAADDLLVRTKADLCGADIPEDPTGGRSADALVVSARTGSGLDELRRVIAGRLQDRAVSLAADALVLRPRHDAALRSARRNLAGALELVEPAVGERTLPQPELVAAAMRAALDDLADLAGDITPDDVLGRVFSTFCVGK